MTSLALVVTALSCEVQQQYGLTLIARESESRGRPSSFYDPEAKPTAGDSLAG